MTAKVGYLRNCGRRRKKNKEENNNKRKGGEVGSIKQDLKLEKKRIK